MKKSILVIVAASLLGCGTLFAVTSEYRSPLSLQRGVLHLALCPVEPEDLWSIVHIWGAGYCRSARKAFIACGDDYYCSSRGATTNTEELATLFFGKDCFRGEEAFAGGILTVPSGVPALSLSKLCPRFKYSEKGVYLGLHAQRDFCESQWHVGMRASLPIKVIDVEQVRSCGSEEVETQAQKLVVRRQEIPNAENPGGNGDDMVNANAYRMDFLSTLNFIDGKPLIKYGDGSFNTEVAGEPITRYKDRGIDPAPGELSAPMYVLTALDGKLSNAIIIGGNGSNPANNPALPGTNNLAQDVKADGTLQASGVTNSSGQRLKFELPINYAGGLALDREAQSKLFLIPNAEYVGGITLTPEANLVQNAIDYVLNQLDVPGVDSAINFFRNHDVDFCVSDRTSGVGDLYFEWYGGYRNECDDWYLDGLVGLTLPTGKRPCDMGKRIYYQSTGNNGHLELRLGLEGGYRPTCWFGIRTFLSFNRVMNRTEWRAPYFEKARVRNIPAGEPIATNVAWNYLWGSIDFNFFHPDCPDCGFVIGYEGYAKGKDKLCFCSSTAKDFLGNINRLDECLATSKTDVRTHKIRCEFFHRVGYCEYFIGGYGVIAGRYAMKEASFNAGVAIYF